MIILPILALALSVVALLGAMLALVRVGEMHERMDALACERRIEALRDRMARAEPTQ